MKIGSILAAAEKNNGSIIPLIVVLGLLAIWMVVSFFMNRKRQKEAAKSMEELKVGDKVVTNAGVYGEIVSMRHTDFGKVVLLKTGEDDKVGYMSVNMSCILGKDEKKDVIVDSEGNIINPEAEEEKKAEATTEQPATEEKSAEKAEPVKPAAKKSKSKKETETKTEEVAKTDEKPVEKKTTTKKSPAKKSTK